MNRFKRRIVRAVAVSSVALLAAIALVQPVRADVVPALVPVQGQLTDVDGIPVDGPHDVSLLLYATETGGTSLHAETHTQLVVAQGTFTAYLGRGETTGGTPLSLDLFRQNPVLWLEVVIDGTDVITPRFQLGTVPYAAVAAHAGLADQATEAAHAAAATTATNATEADHALACDSATNATQLGGKAPSAYTYAAGPGLALSAGNEFFIPPGSLTGAMLANNLSYGGGMTLGTPASGAALTVSGGGQTLTAGANFLESTSVLNINTALAQRTLIGGVLSVAGTTNLQNVGALSATVSGNTLTGSATVTGDVDVAGRVLFGYEMRVCNNTDSCACTSGKKVLGGGAFDGTGNVLGSTAFGENIWLATCQTPPCDSVTVICARVGD